MNQLNLLNAENKNLESKAEAEAKPEAKKEIDMEPGWLDVLQPEFDKPYMKDLRAFLMDEMSRYTIYPPGKNIFNAFWKAPFENVRVVIIGQDPYHGPKQAHGLCFSVQRGVPFPPSLRNIFQELKQSLDIPVPKHGCLEHWAEQGVFLLNTVLTVRAGQAHSHAGKGWETFTDKVIEELNEQKEGIIFLLWGSPAKKKAAKVNRDKHYVLESVHPSPLSAHRGFFGCDHFKKTNEILAELGKEPIDWSLPD